MLFAIDGREFTRTSQSWILKESKYIHVWDVPNNSQIALAIYWVVSVKKERNALCVQIWHCMWVGAIYGICSIVFFLHNHLGLNVSHFFIFYFWDSSMLRWRILKAWAESEEIFESMMEDTDGQEVRREERG